VNCWCVALCGYLCVYTPLTYMEDRGHLSIRVPVCTSRHTCVPWRHRSAVLPGGGAWRSQTRAFEGEMGPSVQLCGFAFSLVSSLSLSFPIRGRGLVFERLSGPGSWGCPASSVEGPRGLRGYRRSRAALDVVASPAVLGPVPGSLWKGPRLWGGKFPVSRHCARALSAAEKRQSPASWTL
jgi:hypothetical protein